MLKSVLINEAFKPLLNPKLITVYHVLLKLTFAISCFFFILIVIFVLRKSQKLGNYKWFILFNASAGFFFDVVIAIFEPIGIFPIAGIFVRLPFDIVEPKMCWVAIICIFLSAAVLTFGVTVTLLYRYIIVLPNGEKLLKKWPYFVIGILIFVSSAITASFLVFHNVMTGDNVINSLEQQLIYVQAYAPEYEQVIKTQMTIFTKFEYVELFIKILGFTIAGLLVALLGLLFIMHLQIQKASTHLSEHTNVLHRMIFASVVAEAVTLILLLGIPLIFFLLALAYKLPNGPQISIFVYMLTSTHSIFFSIMVILTIKPYRMTIVKLLRILMGKQTISFLPGINSTRNTSITSLSHKKVQIHQPRQQREQQLQHQHQQRSREI